MKQKILFPSLVANLAIQSGKSKKQCEDFLRELFNIVEEALIDGEIVKIKGLGTFKLVDVDSRKSVNVNTGENIEIPGHKKVTFIPAKELSEKVNEPFAMFESIEVPEEDNQEEQVEEVEKPINDTIDEPTEIAIEENIEDFEEEPETAINTYNLEEELEEGGEAEAEAEEEIENAEVNVAFDDAVESREEYTYEEPKPKKNFRFLWGFLCGIACTIFIAFGVVLFLGAQMTSLLRNLPFAQVTVISQPSKEEPAHEDQVTDTARTSEEQATEYEEVEKSVPTTPSDKVVIDTISRTRYLSTMAQEHYGNFNLWPYIYFENQAKLGHPDHIKPGTPVVVPSLSKYGIDPNNPADIKIAKKKGIEIYAKYQ